jgi:hypothetical protein
VKKLAAAAVCLALACARRVPEAREGKPEPPAPPNLLELTRGAAVVSRTGEASLTSSALRAIDGDPSSIWANPPENLRQTLVYSLPARARIEQLGLTTSPKPPNEIRSARFELSDDGEHFADAGTFSFVAKLPPQFFPIKPSTARFVRVTSLTGNSPSYLQINTVHAIGTLLDAVRAASIDGCWTIDGTPGSFTQSGAAVRGTVEKSTLEGGSDGKFYRFAWIRGPEYGLAAISVTPDGKHLSGIVWHEEAIQATQFLADDWLGEKCGGQALLPVRTGEAPVLHTYLQRFGYFPLYGLRFDDAGHLDEAESASTLDEILPLVKPNTRFVAHELIRDPATAQMKVDTLRAALLKRGAKLNGVEFVSMGARDPRRPAGIDLTRAMYSNVELQIRR